MHELIIDSFAGGGGASTGIEAAIGRPVDIAIDHDLEAIVMHRANHPGSRHYCENIWTVDPREATGGRPVGLLWASPDCKHFSRAKGAKPVEKSIRGLAWVVLKWAALARPRVIMLENVPEFVTWGPVRKGRPVKRFAGRTFEQWKSQLEALGYRVEYRQLTACDYGAPTSRTRFYLIARRDGRPIIWPEPTHGAPGTLAVSAGTLKPWRTAAECIDWSIPCPSIFERKRPLAEATLRRIAKGIMRYVVNNPEPFIVCTGHTGFGGDGRQYRVDEPLTTIVSKAEHCLVTPKLEPAAAFISKYFGGNYSGPGSDVRESLPTVTAWDHNSLVTSHLVKLRGEEYGQSMDRPMPTITAGGLHYGDVRAFPIKYYGQGVGQEISAPLDTVTANDRFALVTIHGQPYAIADIGLRMLEPRELFRAQGFPEGYIIGRDAEGRPYSKKAQVARVGNSVCPPVAEALVRTNLAEICKEAVA